MVFAEIVPKSLGVAYSRVAAPWFAWPIQGMVWALYPFVRAGEGLTALLAPRRGREGPSEEEIIALASLGARGGAISPKEAHWVQHVLRLNDVAAVDIMTPRPVMRTLLGEKTIGELGPELLTLNFSRIPVVTEEGPDFITGIALRRKLVNAYLEGRRDAKVADLQETALFVPATMRGHQLLHFFIEHKMHLAVVVDEYGGVMGLVTLEDVIEAMLGEEIVGEFDAHPDLRQYARERAAARFKRQPGGDR
jgi:CBS domain containing-hemolysin-like protein